MRRPRKDGPARVIGYVRVSTEEQAQDGVSLDAQRHRLKAYADAHGLDLVGIEADEGISAKRTSNRPALQSALVRLRRKEADGLAVVKLDRLSRTTRDVLDLVATSEREGWALHSIEERLDTGSPHGRFVVTVLAALAQMEREQIGARTKAAMRELQRQGRRVSPKPPFGHRFQGDRVVEDEYEQAVLGKMLALRDAGRGAFQVAAALGRAGIHHPRMGTAFTYGQVKSILATVARREAGSAG